jgi:hypothetical protein
MIAFEVIYFVAFLFSGGVLLMGTGSGAEQGSLNSADSLFRAGKFAEAGRIYLSVVAEDPGNF